MRIGRFQAGGALTDRHADVYIERQADRGALSHILAMDYLLVIEPRQQGKTSLINRLMCHPGVGDCVFVYVDVTTPNRSNESTWYQTLCPRILKQLSNSMPDGRWPEAPHNSTGWRDFLRGVAASAARSRRRVVIELDEIGAVTFPGNTEFFAVLRDIYSSRQAESEFRQLTFLLAGAFHPRNLIKDDRISPFNIAHRLRLPDFTEGQVLELVQRGGWVGEQAELLSERIHYWTNGQPYLTQLLCTYLGDEATPSEVDAGVERLRREDENHFPPMLEKINSNLNLRNYLERIRAGQQIRFYPQENPRQSQLELVGILKADVNGFCAIRNRIYEQALAGDGTVSSAQDGGKGSREHSSGKAAETSPEVETPENVSPIEAPAPGVSEGFPRPSVDTPAWPRKTPFRPNILVMKGGGIKGLAYVGALKVLEEYGYYFEHFVGTSAGAISAALLAVGYTPTELGDILEETNFKEFKDGWLLLSLPSLFISKGLYRGEAFRVWLENLLRAKFPQFADAIEIRFSHLVQARNGAKRLSVFASLKGRTAYCFDSKNPANADDSIAFACRCSMAIPYLFRPERIAGKWVVDGGMQNNYPVYALLMEDPMLRATANFIGLYLGYKKADRSTRWLLLDLFSIWSESGDEDAKTKFIDRTIVIDPRPVKTTDFSLSENDIKFLLAEGRASALHWLYHWGDGKRPSLEVVTEAGRESARLRALIITERWRRFLPKLILAILLLLAIIVYAALK